MGGGVVQFWEMLIMQDLHGLVLWPKREIASITLEFERYRCVMRDGSVAHRPGARPEGPWVLLGESQVMPDLLRRSQDGWVDPADFEYPGGELEPVPAEPAEVELPGLPCLPRQILSLQGEGGKAWWHTELGDFEAGMYASQAARLHPELVHAGRGVYVNRRRLRRILNERKRFRLVLDNGLEFTVSYGPHEKLCADLGLPHLYYLEPCRQVLYREGLRDYPFELKLAPGNWLRAHFPTLRLLLANMMWQTKRWREMGRIEVIEYGDEHRAYYYDPLKSAIHRAGFSVRLKRVALPDPLDDRWWRVGAPQLDLRADGSNYREFLDVLGTLVGLEQLFTFQQLGFVEPRPDLRQVGDRLPEVLLLTEKHSLSKYTRLIGQKFGVSSLIMGGLPSLLSSEFFALALSERGVTSIRIIAYVDFDPGGWIAARSFGEQMRRYGIEVTGLEFLVLPPCFSPEEIELHSEAIPMHTPQIRGKVMAWVADSGGIGGEARSMGADHLKPVARVLERFTQLLEEKSD